jgi:hypothetical protein
MKTTSETRKDSKKSRKDIRGGHIPPIIKQFEDIERNEPCPCGSEKKFKFCHMKQRYDLPREAVVLKNISHIMKAGDVLIKKGEFYVLRGQEIGIHVATYHPERPWFLRWLKWIVKPQTFNTPNHYSAANVELMADYFNVRIIYKNETENSPSSSDKRGHVQ